MMDSFIQRLRDRLGNPQTLIDRVEVREPRVFPPVSEAALQTAERTLGFRLPDTLRTIYREVANGGIGPSFGLLGVMGGATDDRGENAVDLYTRFMEFNSRARSSNDESIQWAWPARLLPICYHGCTVYECIDCGQPDPPVVVVDLGDDDGGLGRGDQTATSLRAWLEAWLDEAESPDPQWLRRLDDGQDYQTVTRAAFGGELAVSEVHHLSRLRSLRDLTLRGPRITDEHVRVLTEVDPPLALERLCLHGAPISDAALRHVGAMGSLAILFLGETRITDAGLAHLRQLRLRVLRLGYTRITDAGLEQLHSMRTLEVLDLTRVPATEHGIAALQAALPQCEVEWWPPGS